jgi:hypothetical protein
VIEGNYFQSIDGDALKFSLIRRKLALIPAASVVFICDDVFFTNTNIFFSKTIYFIKSDHSIFQQFNWYTS